MIFTHVDEQRLIQGNRWEDGRKSLAEIQRSSWKGLAEEGNGTEYKSARMRRKNETRWKTRGEKRGKHGGRANHGGERGRKRECVVRGRRKRARGEKEEAVVLRSVRMNAFPLSGEEACCLSLSVIPLCLCWAITEGTGLCFHYYFHVCFSGDAGVSLATVVVPVAFGNTQLTSLACGPSSNRAVL